jgi:hypothetical protein
MWSLFFILSSCNPYLVIDGKAKTVTLFNPTIKQNTRLSGHIQVSGTLTVPKGVVLKIDPGTHIEFAFSDNDGDGIGDGGIIVKGTILAEGQKEEPILFSGARTAPKSWSEILIEYSPASRLTYCEFRDAHWGLHVHYSAVTISYCRFIGNYGGMRFRSGPVTIKKSLFRVNTLGIRYIAANPVIKNNIFQNNTSNIFIREGSTHPVITGNNFLDNKSFAIKLGESQLNHIPAPDNYWGSMKVSEIERVIYDKLDSDYLGRVLYDPIAIEPYSHENP